MGIFGEPIHYALRKTIWDNKERATIRIVFPVSGLINYIMSLRIYKSKIEDLVMSLFKVQVNLMRHAQCLTILERLLIGFIIKPNTELILKDTQDSNISNIFSPEIYLALIKRTILKPELVGGEVTQGVLIVLYSSKKAVINLSLDLKGGISIRHKIYP